MSNEKFNVALIVFFLVVQCFSIPAPDDTFFIQQPDGSELEARWIGDENFHALATSDGYIIVEDILGYYSYANENGKPSGIYAKNAIERSIEETNFLSNLNKISIFNLLLEEAPKVEALEYGVPEFVYKNLMPLPIPNKKLTLGDIRGLVVLVQFSDIKFSSSNAQEQYTDYMNKEGYNEYHNMGSVRDYYIENSMGNFRPTFDIYGPVTLSGTRESYGGVSSQRNYEGGRKALSEALDTLIKWGTVDFSKYDNDGDGVVDFVFMFYAGIGSNYSGTTKAIWPHAWVFSSPGKSLSGNLRAYRYACSNEIDGSAYKSNPNTTVLGGIGTFVHEFGHILGLPDMYDLKNNNAKLTPNTWDVMDQGNYNCPANSDNSKNCAPPYFSAFERMSLGWMTPTELYTVGEVRLDKLNDNVAYSITNPENSDEFFLLEYRTQKNWDKGQKNSGMLIWHIDYNDSIWVAKTVNNDGDHMYVDIEEAVENTLKYASASDVFPGTGHITEFEDFVFWNGSKADIRIYDITESDDYNYATFYVEMEISSSSEVHSSSSLNLDESSSSLEISTSSASISSSNKEESSSSEQFFSSSNNMGITDKIINLKKVSVKQQGNVLYIHLSEEGKSRLYLVGLNGNVIYNKFFEEKNYQISLPKNRGKQTFILIIEQNGKLLITKQIR